MMPGSLPLAVRAHLSLSFLRHQVGKSVPSGKQGEGDVQTGQHVMVVAYLGGNTTGLMWFPAIVLNVTVWVS